MQVRLRQGSTGEKGLVVRPGRTREVDMILCESMCSRIGAVTLNRARSRTDPLSRPTGEGPGEGLMHVERPVRAPGLQSKVHVER
jgi:hypothetical protein